MFSPLPQLLIQQPLHQHEPRLHQAQLYGRHPLQLALCASDSVFIQSHTPYHPKHIIGVEIMCQSFHAFNNCTGNHQKLGQ
jgi:hypothetical protein